MMSNIRTITGGAKLIRDSELIAKKDHVCYLCNQVINAGCKYSNACIALYGEIQTIKTHTECVSIAEHLHSYNNMLPDTGFDHQDFMEKAVAYYTDYKHNPEDSGLYKTSPDLWYRLQYIVREHTHNLVNELVLEHDFYDERYDQEAPRAED